MVALGGLAAACGDDDSPESGDPRQTGEPQPTGATQQTSTPRGGSLRIGVGSFGVPADYFTGTALHKVGSFVQFAWPLFLSSGTEPKPVNALAESYDVAPDGLTHTFTLREGLRFHDGSPLDAEAVAENYRMYMFEDHPLRDDGPYLPSLAFRENGTFESPLVVDSIDAVDQLTMQMVLTEPRVDLRQTLWYMFILNPEILAQEDYGTDPGALRNIGSGPFRITGFEPGSFIEFERFEGFFEEALLDRLRYEQINDEGALALSLRSGDIDVAYSVSQSDHEDLAADPALQELIAPYEALDLLFLLSAYRLPEMADPRVREAVWLALNREAYVEAFFPPGTASLSTQPVAVPGMSSYNPDLEHRPYDPDRARQLLADAGAEALTLKAISSPSAPLTSMRQLWEAVRADLAEIGVELEITLTEEATLQEEQEDNDITMRAYGYEDEFFVFPLYFTDLGGVRPPDPRATNPDVKRLLEATRQTADAEEQTEIFHELMRLDHEELMMGIPLAKQAITGIGRQQVRDFRIASPADPLHQAWIDES